MTIKNLLEYQQMKTSLTQWNLESFLDSVRCCFMLQTLQFQRPLVVLLALSGLSAFLFICLFLNFFYFFIFSSLSISLSCNVLPLLVFLPNFYLSFKLKGYLLCQLFAQHLLQIQVLLSLSTATFKISTIAIILLLSKLNQKLLKDEIKCILSFLYSQTACTVKNIYEVSKLISLNTIRLEF